MVNFGDSWPRSTRAPPPRAACCSTAGADRRGRAAGAPADLPAAGLGRARSGGDLRNVQLVVAGRWTRPACRRRPVRARHRQPARDDGGVGAPTGAPVHNAIVWQDTRTDQLCRELAPTRPGPLPRQAGLPVEHLLLRPEGPLAARQHRRSARARRGRRGAVRHGRLLADLEADRPPRHRRHQRQPDDADEPRDARLGPDLLDAIGVRRPCCRRSGLVGGLRRGRRALAGVPVAAALGDQQAALVGQTCFAPARPSAPTAPAASLLNTGDRPVASTNGLLTTLAYQIGRPAGVYALEGSIAVTGSLVQWFRDNLGLIGTAPEIETLARASRQRRLLLRAGLLGPVRAALALRRARRDRRPDRLHQPGPPRARRAGGDRVADPRGRRGDDQPTAAAVGAARRRRHDRTTC